METLASQFQSDHCASSASISPISNVGFLVHCGLGNWLTKLARTGSEMRIKRCGIQPHGLLMSQVHELCEPDLGWTGPLELNIGLSGSSKGREVPGTGVLGLRKGGSVTHRTDLAFSLWKVGFLPPGWTLARFSLASAPQCSNPWPSPMFHSALQLGSSWPSSCSQAENNGPSFFLLGFPQCPA